MVRISEEINQRIIGDWLRTNGYEVRFEVKFFGSFIDIVAIKENEITSIEVKDDFYKFKDGIDQCLRYSKCSHHVFLAFLESFLEDLKKRYDINNLPFGLIVIDEKKIVKIVKESKKFDVKKNNIEIIKKQFGKSIKEIKEQIKIKKFVSDTPEIKRLIKKITSECLWLYVLTILFEKPRHAYGFKHEIEKQFKFSASIMTIYKVLYLLERHGFIEKVKIKHTSGGPERKYYKILPKGMELLFEGRDILEDIINTLWES